MITMANNNQQQKCRRLENWFAIIDTPPIIYIDSVLLAREVQKYPVIYLLTIRNQYELYHAWERVIAAVVPNFEIMCESNQRIARRNIRTRWSYMRHTLKRDITRKRENAHIHLPWIQEMMFLVPVLKFGNPNWIHNTNMSNRRRRNLPQIGVASNVTTTTIVETTTSTSQLNILEISSGEPFSTRDPLPQKPNEVNENYIKEFIFAFRSKVIPEMKSWVKQALNSIFAEAEALQTGLA